MGSPRKLKSSAQSATLNTDKKPVYNIRIIDSTSKNNSTPSRTFTLEENATVKSLCLHVAQLFSYKVDTFELVIANSTKEVVLNSLVSGSLKDVGIKLEEKTALIIRELEDGSDPLPHSLFDNDEDLDDFKLGASASPTSSGDAPIHQYSPECTSCVSPTHHSNYVGLVNQAMTCYLNSLLQTLFMTPEFRNALYKWKFIGEPDEGNKSIPYQLQRLFIRLQTSERSAVETTDLTRSFGWDSSETWQQHDIQELCRVMFDALEQTFKDTKQKDLISLYEGKMFDYVKCLECSTEKAREDTYLDIPLSIRSFEGDLCYGSVEESLKAFVQPEILNGNNQYFCEKCNKKVDAHKGLKFKSFPYLLTLQLKRFTFDYQTFHRIKLNDRVSFPEILDLAMFVESTGDHLTSFGGPNEDSCLKFDDCSTADSGSAIDDDSAHGTDNSAHSRDPIFNNDQDDDEGISLSTSTHRDCDVLKGKSKHLYELFSVMIHSGSASGGHYYAYIKSLKSNEWYCFNDTNVCKISLDDVRKMYGGDTGGHVYSQSVNAYMLMYRLIDPTRNDRFIEVDEFPDHLKEVLKRNEEMERERREYERERRDIDASARETDATAREIDIYYKHPNAKEHSKVKMSIAHHNCLNDVMEYAHELFSVDAPLGRCRLVKFNTLLKQPELSFNGKEMEPLSNLMPSVASINRGLLLETRAEDEKWVAYLPNYFTMFIYLIDIHNETYGEPLAITADLSDTASEFRECLSNKFGLEASTMVILIKNTDGRSIFLDDGKETIRSLQIMDMSKAFIAPVSRSSNLEAVRNTVLNLSCYARLKITLPDVDSALSELLGVPRSIDSPVSLKESDSLGYSSDPSPSDNDDDDPVDSNRASSIQSDQSASEDSSLTDSVRTLIGDSSDERNECVYNLDNLVTASDKKLNSELKEVFKVVPSKEASGLISLLVFVDDNITIGELKSHLERYVGIKKQCMKLYDEVMDSVEYQLADSQVIHRIIRKKSKWVLKRGPLVGEHLGKLFQYVPNCEESNSRAPSMDFIISTGSDVLDVKTRISREIRLKFDRTIPVENCRLRKKKWNQPGEIYLDGYKFGSKIPMFDNWELFVEMLPSAEPKKSASQVALYVRRWWSCKPKLDSLKEIVLDRNMSFTGLWNTVSEISGIPVDNITIAVMGSYAYSTHEFYDNEKKFEWKALKDLDVTQGFSDQVDGQIAQSQEDSSSPKSMESESGFIPVRFKDKTRVYSRKYTERFDGTLLSWEDGQVLVYRDMCEDVKTLSDSEYKELASLCANSNPNFSSNSLNANSSPGYTSIYSPKREKALKIYLNKNDGK